MCNVVITNLICQGQVNTTQADQYIEITNQGSTLTDISGWKVTLATNTKEFLFPSGTMLQSAQSFRVYTNSVHPESGGFSFGIESFICNDKGDSAKLYDAQGNQVSTWAYDQQGNVVSQVKETTDKLTPEQAQKFYIDALKQAVEQDSEGREFVKTLGENTDKATAPESVQSSYNFYYENVEKADYGSVRLYKMVINNTLTYAVHVTTDGDDGWLEIYGEFGEELGFAHFNYDSLEFNDKDTIRAFV
ncbi:MAG: lamin tail domain-containing protein [Brasilonema angustatum HA4187-MV1]|nr:lamin tail domain-containing protein [Brasilonema angustatum HA4187-MV1]